MKEYKPPKHWIEYVEGLCAVALVAITGTYTYFAGQQASAGITAANAAKSAADTARDALHISESAYVSIGTPRIDAAQGLFYLPIQNTGHIPSGAVDIIVHEATFNSPTIDPNTLPPAAEKHWKSQHFISITPGTPVEISVLLRKIATQYLLQGQQVVVVAGSISANDGFPDTPQRNSLFCWRSIAILKPRQVNVTPCDPGVFLPQLVKVDGYPNGEQEDRGAYPFSPTDRK